MLPLVKPQLVGPCSVCKQTEIGTKPQYRKLPLLTAIYVAVSEREINNLNAPGAFANAALSKAHHHSRRDQTYTKRHRDKLIQGSLENVSSHPLGELAVHESTLRRSRSLAISREDVFTDLEISKAPRNRRSQLIPRAKLIDKYSTKDRCLQRGLSQESLYTNERNLIKRKSSVGGDYGVPQQILSSGPKSQLIVANHVENEGVEEEDGDEDRAEKDLPYIHINNFPQPQAVGSGGGAGEIDSLDSNYHNKTSLNTIYGVSHENLVYPDVGLSLPNYYPDSKCDTDLSFTDNVSVNDTITTQEAVISDKSNPQINGFSIKQSKNHRQKENISYDENIVLSKNTLYDKIAENNYYAKSKPRTIRGNTPYRQESESFYNGKPRSLPNYTSNYDSESSLSDYDPKYYEPIEKLTSDTKSENATETESDSNQQISKVIKEDNENENIFINKSDFSNIEANPIYDEIPLVTDITLITKEIDQIPEQTANLIPPANPIKTSIQVQGIEEDYIKREVSENSDEYRTIVNVSDEKSINNNPESEDGSPREAKKHSHNYLKEFLETQKGSKKPLQNFLSKRISRAFNGERSKPKKASNLIDNQYFSLPDITVSKNLQKCEKIDRKLRKCDSKQNKNIPEPSTTTNRFIVNIGNHFDVTAHSSIPVDFELKISKIPKSQKSKKHKSTTEDREKSFLDAVKNLKQTLKPESKINKITVNGEDITDLDCFQRDKEVEVLIEDKMSEKKEITKEYQEKIHTMRNYWGNIVNDQPKAEKSDLTKEETEQHKCKIVGVQTKVEEVKKKFEKVEEASEKPSIVQTAKQIFEKKPTRKAKDCRGLLENPFFENQLESLSSNVVEIIEKPKHHKPVVKSKSITSEPEFDHVRYRVMKSDLFQKKIFANCEKESQFDGLMQYLQDYSFQELLIDNNIVIIEPIRTNVQYIGPKKCKTTRNMTQFVRKSSKDDGVDKNGMKRHFFYHPIRVNREVNDDELPNPDTVKQVRQLFEGGLTRSQSSKNLDMMGTQQYTQIDPDKDRCSATDSNPSELGSNENLYETLDNDLCCDQYVSEDIMEKIRECGTSITYYGGRVLNKRSGKCDSMTKAIMDEIQNQKRHSECNCRKNSTGKSVTFIDNNKAQDNNDTYQGIKFKLLKSNSCSSRLELVGTKNLAEYRNKFISKQKQLIEQHNLKKQNEEKIEDTKNEAHKSPTTKEKNVINESIKENINKSPKIIGEEMKTTKKLIQWGEMNVDGRTYTGINFTKNTAPPKPNYDYHNYVIPKTKKLDEMEFEPYEIA
ncbi:PREDICTED: uncharacterized protein LOC108560218 [Nicrophorus vespilloides]|uniref:Uncharacterized protein LOC108560218 n=1 Tax=Nicrophorus vespilloides TaxID=110193 RepID=A0ABM1MF12_NICVS|nr:PREDICTED: uncharacterized protein LOC108560218 [Nicrophorus vespilloides]